MVQHRQGARRGVVGDHGGYDAQRQPRLLCHCLGGIEHLAAAHANHPIAAQAVLQRSQALDLGAGDFAIEHGVVQAQVGLIEADGQGLFEAIQTALAGDDQKALAKPGDMPVEAFKLFVALNVAAGCGEDLGHSHLPPRSSGNAQRIACMGSSSPFLRLLLFLLSGRSPARGRLKT